MNCVFHVQRRIVEVSCMQKVEYDLYERIFWYNELTAWEKVGGDGTRFCFTGGQFALAGTVLRLFVDLRSATSCWCLAAITAVFSMGLFFRLDFAFLAVFFLAGIS